MSLIHLAQHSEQASWSAREIAENYDIPLELLSKILQRLVQRGLLTSHPGIHGGYSLGRPAEKISAADVIEAIEGPVSLTNCFSDDGMCGQFDKCNLKSPLHRLNDIVLQTFRNLTIEQMSQQQSEDFRSRFMSQDRLISISTLR
jgi:Rrf2 family protein